MANDLMTQRFDPCEDGYLYIDKQRLVRFTAQERDAYVEAYAKARLPWPALAALVLGVGGVILASLVLPLNLPRGTVSLLIIGAGFLADHPGRKVMTRLAQDAAARPKLDRPVGKREMEARLVRRVPWSTIVTVLALGGWTLFNSVTHLTQSPVAWLVSMVTLFFMTAFAGVAYRKVFDRPVAATSRPLQL